jgi:acyl carrier protein
MNELYKGLEQEVFELVARQLGLEKDKVSLDSSLKEDLGADSLDLVEMAMMLEDKYRIQISDDDTKKILYVKDMIEYLKNNIPQVELSRLATQVEYVK